MASNLKTYEIRYQIGNTSTRSEIVIQAVNVTDMKKILQSMIPGAKILKWAQVAG